MLDLYLFHIDELKVKDVQLPKHIFEHVNKYTDKSAHSLSLAAWSHAVAILNKHHFDWDKLKFVDDAPVLKDTNTYFNISHSNKMFAIAVSDSKVAVDIQELVSIHQCFALYPVIFRNHEHIYLNSNNKPKTLTEAFTQYECCIKLAQPKFVPKQFNTFWVNELYCVSVINTNNENVDKPKLSI